MANHKSALKRIRANDKKRLYNRYYARTMRNAIKSFRSLTDKEEATTKLPGMISMIDKTLKKGIIHKNKAANLKSKLTMKVNAL
ncbi:MAG TPA: 30S ribosomal protein S20 [Bacteroidales bacterium]|nr:30S ribosomal protein S20 [Bacteroidales bacterium]